MMPHADVARVASRPMHDTHVQLVGIGMAYRRYGPRFVALDGVDLTVKQREFVSIIGPSGCGKSTLLMIIAGLLRPTEGSTIVGGEAVTRPLTDVGIVFQRDLLFDWRTVVANVMLQAEVRGLDPVASRDRAMSLLARAGLNGFEHRYPWELSGGMRQRVAICRAMLHDATLLLLDEPFGALDAITRDQMNLDLQDIWSEDRKTAVLVTHSIGEAIFLADRVVVMGSRPGRVVQVIDIELPRPRAVDVRESAAFARYQGVLRDAIGHA
ncbi:MAG TPA: ABC transporter ATP-binding protein [Casimicrobiaceae bacterium]|nr:ABC transporter ATP-binding protein [Casimicrobiaceae bacterium]